MKRLTFIAVILASFWGLFWCTSAYIAKRATLAWIATQEDQGLIIDFTHLGIRGFPNRIDITVRDLALTDSRSNIVWETPFLQSHALVYNPLHQIISFADHQTLSNRMGNWIITSDGLRASAVASPTGRLLRLKAEAADLTLEHAENQFAFANVNLGLLVDENDAETYRFVATSDALLTDQSPPDQAKIDTYIELDRPLHAIVIDAARPQPTSIDIRTAEYTSGGLDINLAGRLELDDTGRPTGNLALQAANWRELVTRAITAGIIPQGQADALERGLELLAGFSGNRDTLDVPLTFNKGAISLGVFPLGQAPRIRF